MSSDLPEIDPKRNDEILSFLEGTQWRAAERRHLAGDASHRRYERLHVADGCVGVLMDSPVDPFDTPLPGQGKSYGEIAHLAYDCKPFAAIGEALRAMGIRAPELFHFDYDKGFLLIEDLGDAVFKPVIEASSDPAATEAELYRAAVDVLLEMHKHKAPTAYPLPGGGEYVLPPYDDDAKLIELDLLAEWYAPTRLERELTEGELSEFKDIWAALLPKRHLDHEVLVLRDYHSPNLLWLDGATSLERVGVIDYQDGLRGSAAYDLASLLQDARRTVPEKLERELLDYYVEASPFTDKEAVRQAYAVLSLQRNSKILGIFCRLCKRDGKPQYLDHLPRIWEYVERSLVHPVAADLRAWFDKVIPAQDRK